MACEAGVRVAIPGHLARFGQCVLLVAVICGVTASQAQEGVNFTVSGDRPDLADDLRAASLLLAIPAEEKDDPQAVFAAARGEYSRLIGALYAKGYYSPVISVLIDGREAAGIAPLDVPNRISQVTVAVDPGPVFAFARANVAPLAPGTDLPDGFRTGAVAESDLIADAVTAGIDGWRGIGHAKAAPDGQRIVADHDDATLSADVTLDPGPRLRFGRLTITGEDRMRERRIRKIAGLPEGAVFDPAELERAADRLRRTGVFRSVTLAEADTITAPDLIGITLTVAEEKPRRYSIGAEIASLEGVTLSGFWLHRNLLGGAERFRIDGEIANIGAQNSGVDYSLGVTIDRPATVTPDTTLTFNTRVERLDEEDFSADTFTLGIGFTQIFSPELTARVGLQYDIADGTDDAGDFRFRNLGLPIGATWDRRDSKVEPTRGFYLDAEIKPFLGFGTTDSGARLTFDARAYRGLGDDNRIVLAARAQGGLILGSRLLATPRDDLFYSGGGGTVRGQPFQSLGVTADDGGTPVETGGTRFVAISAELRAKVTDTIGIVGFVDAGHVSDDSFANPGADWHAGAGLGLRYATGFGPIRLDIAAPIGGDTGEGVQFYVGIGQAF
jgi:translocation and assembly module TamA